MLISLSLGAPNVKDRAPINDREAPGVSGGLTLKFPHGGAPEFGASPL